MFLNIDFEQAIKEKKIELKTDIQKTQHYNYAATKGVMNPQNWWIYLKNACCVQLNLVH